MGFVEEVSQGAREDAGVGGFAEGGVGLTRGGLAVAEDGSIEAGEGLGEDGPAPFGVDALRLGVGLDEV